MKEGDPTFQILLEAVGNDLWIADKEMAFTFASPSVARLLGCSTGELMSASIHQYLTEASGLRLRRAVRKGTNGHLHRWPLEYLREDGTPVPMETAVRFLRDGEGAYKGIVGVLCDPSVSLLSCANEMLVQVLADRDAALEGMAAQLRKEVAARERMAADLTAREKELAESAAALNVLLRKLDQEKEEIKQSITANLIESVHPYIEKLEKSGLNSRQKKLLGVMSANLAYVTSPFLVKISLQYANLTPTEISIAKMVREGRTTKMIAEIMHVSENAVLFHRSNLRKKLGLVDRKVNLRGFLAFLEEAER